MASFLEPIVFQEFLGFLSFVNDLHIIHYNGIMLPQLLFENLILGLQILQRNVIREDFSFNMPYACFKGIVPISSGNALWQSTPFHELTKVYF